MSAKTYWLLVSVPIWTLTFSLMLGAILALGAIALLLRGAR